MQRILLELGPVTIYSYGAMIALGFLLVSYGMGRLAPQIGLTFDNVIDLLVGAAVGGIVGSRLYYVLAYNFPYYLQNPLQIFNIREGGLVYFGGLIGGAIVVIGLMRYRKWPMWEIADLAAVFVPLGYFFGRVGCFLNGCCFGITTNSFWGVRFRELDGNSYHPTMVYLGLFSLCLFLFALWFRKRRTFAGQAFLLYLIFYSIGRFSVEFLRINPMVFGLLTVSQVTGLLTVIVACVICPILRRKNAYITEKSEDDGDIKSA